MDRAFLEYYEEELNQIRYRASEFAQMNPTIAGRLGLDSVPCPDPYVERLLEGVAFLAARTHHKLDFEAGRFARAIMDALYPDILAQGPATGVIAFEPKGQIGSMRDGHLLKKGTRLIAGLTGGLSTRATYRTVQDVTLWPIRLKSVELLSGTAALNDAGHTNAVANGAQSGVRLQIVATHGARLGQLSIEKLELCVAGSPRAPQLFDALVAHGASASAQLNGENQSRRDKEPVTLLDRPSIVGLDEDEALLPSNPGGYPGYRLLREYFLMPERFYFLRIDGLSEIRANESEDAVLNLTLTSRLPADALQGVTANDFQLFGSPIVNLFEAECDSVEVKPFQRDSVVYVDRSRPLDYEIYGILSVKDATRNGGDTVIDPLFCSGRQSRSGLVWHAKRQPRRANGAEVSRKQFRSQYAGDDFFISVARTHGNGSLPKNLDIRALVTNRDLPRFDDRPTLTLDAGDPVDSIRFLSALRPPRPSLSNVSQSPARADAVIWRLVSQLSLNFISLVEGDEGRRALMGLLDIYADRGAPEMARHAQAISALSVSKVVRRMELQGPLCYGHGMAIDLEIDDSYLSGHSRFLIGAILAELFRQHISINSFAEVSCRLGQTGQKVCWPLKLGQRGLI